MKKKSAKKSKRISPEKVNAEAEPLPVLLPEVSVVSVTVDSADPRVLLQLAEEEPDQRELDEYVPVIETLRNKNFSYREIAQWFSEHGVPFDHNTIYRLYTKHLSGYHAALEEERANEEERDEAYRNSQ